MSLQVKPMLGAVALAVFITACLGWLFRSVGTPLAWWGYLALSAVFALLVYALARLLRKSRGRDVRVRAVDTYEDLE